jgi:acyl-CoA thioester hydrolase
MTSETKLTVRYQETDQMGIVHHSVYPIWFECGRTDLIKHAGLAYSHLENLGIGLPLIGMECKFLYPAHYEDEILVKSGVINLTPVRITFCYEIFKKGYTKAIVSGQTEHVWANDKLKPVNMKKYRPDIYKLMETYFVEDVNHEEK